MTSSNVYWVLQIDTILSAVNGLLVASSIISAILFIVYCICKLCVATSHENTTDYKFATNAASWVKKPMLVFLAVFSLSLGAHAFTPSTKTVAAMYILPQIVTSKNIDTIKKDFSELYDLSVLALKDALKDGNSTQKESSK